MEIYSLVPGVSDFGRFGPWWDIFERKIIFGPWEIKSYQNGSLGESFGKFTCLVPVIWKIAKQVPRVFKKMEIIFITLILFRLVVFNP